MLYTFITEKDGSTVVEQFEGNKLEEVLLNWNDNSISTPNMAKEILEEDLPTPLNGLKNAWCISGISRDDKFVLAHIIATWS